MQSKKAVTAAERLEISQAAHGCVSGTSDECHKMPPTADPEDRRMARPDFTPGHAKAIAEQWGAYILEKR